MNDISDTSYIIDIKIQRDIVRRILRYILFTKCSTHCEGLKMRRRKILSLHNPDSYPIYLKRKW